MNGDNRVDLRRVKFGRVESALRRVDKKLACTLEIGSCALRPAERREIPVDWAHRMSTADSRALENSREALEFIVPPAEALVRGCCDVGLAQDVRRDCSGKRNKLGGRSHRHSDWDREHGAQDQNNGGPLFSDRLQVP